MSMATPIIAALLSLAFAFHDFHVTHTTLRYNSSTQDLEITIKVAIESLEAALEDRGAEALRLGAENEHASADAWIDAYINERLILSPDGEAVEMAWIGKEISTDLHDVYLYLEVAAFGEAGLPESMTVGNTLFTDILPDQANTVLLEFGALKRNLTLSKDNPRERIALR